MVDHINKHGGGAVDDGAPVREKLTSQEKASSLKKKSQNKPAEKLHTPVFYGYVLFFQRQRLETVADYL